VVTLRKPAGTEQIEVIEIRYMPLPGAADTERS
jgi:hypothetical protein